MYKSRCFGLFFIIKQDDKKVHFYVSKVSLKKQKIKDGVTYMIKTFYTIVECLIKHALNLFLQLKKHIT